ncbi:ABC transporter substrate-binding protein [Glaciimonas sp. PCH181]|uniref:ABC transporter substrate-binding protein n=1 Tax=Glaciimonas sp. PCH181 TaxID=2133943 RepID=UPI000D3458A8|nr:ABC transporter substrate-binding protein [Glaciimonas sp. PCH181]PUA19636.1 ABC transporter substrate-binding protein [Glaciimonas sp. PCH181]
MMKNGKFVAKLGLVAVLSVCAGLASAQAKKTLVYCSEASPEGFSPQLYTTGTTFDASANPIFNRLVAFELGTTTIKPSLAESWTISDDGLVYTFKLRKGVKFHSNTKFKPSRDFNADDVVFTFDRMGDPANPYHTLARGQTFGYYLDMGLDRIIDKVEKVDDNTVRFKLKHPESPFLADLVMYFASIYSAEYAGQLQKAGTPELLDRDPIGTGPFEFVSYQKDAVIRYKAFDAYWDGRPKIDNLIFAITPDASVRFAKLKANECQVMSYPKPADLAAMKADKDINLISKPGMNIGYIAFNVDKKPFDNKLVRQALSMAIDKETILKTVYQGAGQAAKNPIPPTLWSYNDKIKDYPFDLKKAKELLTKAGYPNGAEIEMWYLPVQRPYNPDGKRIGELIQSDWAKIGVKVKLTTYEWGEYLKRSKQGDQQSMMFGWSGDNGDPDNFFGNLLSCEGVKGGGNVSRWCDKDFDALILKAKLVSKQSDRAALYEKAQVIAHEEAPWIDIAHSVGYVPVRKNVIGFKIPATPYGFYFDKVDLAK